MDGHISVRNFAVAFPLVASSKRGTRMPLYRAYLREHGHVWAAIDLACVDDDEAKQQVEDLGNGRVVELWQRDRRVALLKSPRRVLRGAHSRVGNESQRSSPDRP
jgi:hypothetical protein